METFSPDGYEVKEDKVKPVAKPFPMTQVFVWLGIGLLITAVISLSLPNLLLYVDSSAASITYIVLMVIAALAMLPCMVIVNMSSFKPRSVGTKVAYIVYTAAMGVLLSAMFTMVIEYLGSGTDALWTIGLAFLITAVCFLVMGIVGASTKKNLSMIWPVLSALALGCLIISLVNVFLGSSVVYWVIDFVMLAIILLVCAIDINRVKKMAETKMLDSDRTTLAVYCALNLYVDFIYIFVRILTYIVVFFGHRRS